MSKQTGADILQEHLVKRQYYHAKDWKMLTLCHRGRVAGGGSTLSMDNNVDSENGGLHLFIFNHYSLWYG